MQYLNIWYQKDWTYTIKNIDLAIYLGASNIELRNEVCIPLKQFYIKFTKTFKWINQKWYILSNINDYYYFESADDSKYYCLSNKIIKNNPKISYFF